MKKVNAWMERRSITSFVLALLVGAYLIYAIWQMYNGLNELSGSPMPVYCFMALFAFAAIVLLAGGVYALIGGHYAEKHRF